MTAPSVLERLEQGNWGARSFARFWEPGVEDYARRKLHLPAGAHVDAAMLDALKVAPYREVDGPVPGNQVTNDGLQRLWIQLCAGSRAWTATSAGSGFTGIAVGNATSGSDAKADTDLAGSSKSYRACDNTFPLLYPSTHPVTAVALTQGQALFSTTFGSGEANFDWNEYGVLVPNSSASAVSTGTAAAASLASFGGGNYKLLNHKLPAGLGTKTSGASASLYVLISIL